MNTPELSKEEVSKVLITISVISIIVLGLFLYRLKKKKSPKIKMIICLLIIVAVIVLAYYSAQLYSNQSDKYPVLTSSIPKEQLELNADMLIAMLPEEARNCSVLDSMHQDIKETISQNSDDPNMNENLKINNDLFNILSYKLKLKCTRK